MGKKDYQQLFLVKKFISKNKNDIEFAQPQDIAEEIFRISQQKRSAWSFDVELRPDIEKW